MLLRYCLAGLFALAVSGCTKLPEEYVFRDVAPVDTNEYEKEGPFKVIIKREAWSPLHKDYLILAERLFPKPEIVATSAAQADGGISAEEIAAADEPLWWNRTYNYIRIPFALTSTTVYYYKALLKTLSEQPQYTAGHLTYTAEVDQKSEYEVNGERMANITVVIMRLEWGVTCGEGCSHSFDMERHVVFDARQAVLAVEEAPPELKTE